MPGGSGELAGRKKLEIPGGVRATDATVTKLANMIVRHAIRRWYVLTDSNISEEDRWKQLNDLAFSIIAIGPPGVGKSQIVEGAAKKLAKIFSEKYQDKIEVVNVPVSASPSQAEEIFAKVIAGKAIPVIHLYATTMPVWAFGLPAPLSRRIQWDKIRTKAMSLSDNVPELREDLDISLNEWKIPAFLLPFVDTTQFLKNPSDPKRRVLPALFIIDELNRPQSDDLLKLLFELLRSADNGVIKLNPATLVVGIMNPSEGDRLASDLHLGIIDRAMIVNVLPPTIQEWVKYMYDTHGDRWDDRVGSYLLFNFDPETELYWEDKEGQKSIVTARTLSYVAVALYQHEHGRSDVERIVMRELRETPSDLEEEERRIIRSHLPASMAEGLIGFIEMIGHGLNLEEIHKHPEKIADLSSREQIFYALVKMAKTYESEYLEASRHKNEKKMDEAIEKLTVLVRAAWNKVGGNAVSHAMSVLDYELRSALADRLADEPKIAEAARGGKKKRSQLERLFFEGEDRTAAEA